MRKIKNMFLVLMMLMIVSAVQGQNPQTIRKTLGTSNDTTLFGVKGSRTIKIENIGTDSVFTYVPDKDGNFSATNYIAIGKGDKAVLKFDGIKIINKGKSAGVNIIMYINDVDVIRKTSGLDTSKSYNFTSPITFDKLIANRILSNEIDSVHSTYWYNDTGGVIGYINSATSEVAFFDKMTVGEMNTTTTVASNYIWTNNLGTDTLYGNSPIITKDTIMPLDDNYATLGTDQKRWSAIYGYKVALGTANNLVSKLAIGMTDSTGAFNIVRSDKNTNRSTLTEASDTSSINFRFKPSGSPMFYMKDKNGLNFFYVDSTNLSYASSLQANSNPAFRVNSATNTTLYLYSNAGTGNSVQLSAGLNRLMFNDDAIIRRTGVYSFAVDSNLTVTKQILQPSGTVNSPSYSYSGSTNSGWYYYNTGHSLSLGGNNVFRSSFAGIQINSNYGYIQFLTDINAGTGRTTYIDGSVANNLSVLNGTSAQFFNVYDKYTDASNYRRLRSGWGTDSVAVIGTENIGQYTARGLTIKMGTLTEPLSPVAGQIYFNGTSFYGYNGIAWKQLDN